MGKVRVEFIADFGPRRGQTFAGVVVERDYDAILKAALNKLNLKKNKQDLLLVLRDRYTGTRVLSRDSDLEVLLRDGATIVLTTQQPAAHVPKPPRWPWPGSSTGLTLVQGAEEDPEIEVGDCDTEAGTADSRNATHAPSVALPRPSLALEHFGDMCGPWAVLQGNVLPLVRRAISETHGFQEKCMGDYIAFDYHAGNASQLPDMFPNPEMLPSKGGAKLLAAVRRECRGLLVSATGDVLARRLPKFFNIDEVEETKYENLPHTGGVATQKIDGSLVSPFILNGEIRWAGKSTVFPLVEKHAARTSLNGIVAKVLEQQCTPTFEWCEVGPPVGVITHTEARLTLIAVRNNITGEFWDDRQVRSLGCEVVNAIPFEDFSSLLQETRSKFGVEGVVVRWPDSGRMVKLKTLWWITLSGSQKKAAGRPARALLDALQSVPLSSIPPSIVWQAVMDGDDDQMSLVYGRLTPEAQTLLRAFANASQRGILMLDQELREWAECAREATEADLAKVAGGWPAGLLASYHRRATSAERELRKFLLKMAGAGQMSGLEALVGTYWEGGRQTMEFCAHLGTFEKAPGDIMNHVLSKYLPRKLEHFMGGPISDDSAIHVARHYDPSEGKIKGLWEEFTGEGIIDLRVDLQPRDKVFSFHNGDADFAHWQVQFGPNDNCPRSTKAQAGDRKGAFAGVLMRTGMDIEFGLIRDAFKLSFETQKVVRIDPSPSKVSHIYLDLDGVLVDFEAGFNDAFGSLPDLKTRWQHIEKTPGFYNMLPWMDGACRLWNHVRQLNVPTTILTGIPEGALGERSATEKRDWVTRELGDVEVITCLSREKPSFSGLGHLLIDDRSQKGWETVGGRQITHRSVSETLFALADMGLGRNFTIPRDDISVVSSITEELRAARNEAERVAIDAEWPLDRAGAVPSKAAVLQLAFHPCSTFKAFVVDLLAWDRDLEKFVAELLASDLPKLVFGTGDQERLEMQIEAAIDLQEDSQSLLVQARKCGLLLKKSKQLQASDWSARPLRDEQIVYAGTDAAVLLELEGGRAATKARHAAPSAGRNASVEYVGVFLTPEARKKLLRRVPPLYQEVVAGHMTLEWMPQSIKGLSVGSSVKLEVTGKGQDEKVQAVSVVTNEAQPRSGHITISHKQDAAANYANDLQFVAMEESFTVDGVVGVSVMLGVAETQTLPEQIMDRVVSLTEGQAGQSERFENISDSQRHALHLLAEEYGLEHRSEGKKGTPHRKLILTVPRKWKKPQTKSRTKCEERTVVKDARKFAAIFGDIPGLQLHGRVAKSGICWQLGVMLPPVFERLVTNTQVGQWGDNERIVVIMRGFPGSGKSSVASWLRKQAVFDLASADDFFTDAEHLQDAHDKCRDKFMESLAAKRSVIVDNTNVQKREYSFYKSRAEAEGYDVVVLELVCDSKKELERFRSRSIHGVDGRAVGSMWTRWEHDPSALRLAPYEPQELMAWVMEQGMCGHPPNTHLVMPSGPFLSVPTAALADFCELHAAEWGRNYISEIGRPQAFQMFFDIDGLDRDVLLSTLAKLRPLVDDADMVITGFDGPPPGYHVFVVGKIVDSATAFTLRKKWLEVAPELGEHVDDQLYRNPQLRLLGSRKTSKDGVDLGRVHEAMGRFDADGWHEGGKWDWREISIHIW